MEAWEGGNSCPPLHRLGGGTFLSPILPPRSMSRPGEGDHKGRPYETNSRPAAGGATFERGPSCSF